MEGIAKWEQRENKKNYIEDIVRKNTYESLHLVLQGKINSKRGTLKRRISWLTNLSLSYRKAARNVAQQILQMKGKEESFSTK